MGLFNSDYSIGLKGDPQEVRERAATNESYDKKLKVLEGCIAAYEASKPDNLRAFFQSYLDFKRSEGCIKGTSPIIDEGFAHLLAAPFLTLLEKSSDQEKTMYSLARGMTPFYAEVTLTVALLHARHSGRWPAARKFLEKHIDIDDTGYNGPVGKIRARAKLGTGWSAKAPLLEGCLRAFDGGKPEHLKAFIGGYLEFKRGNGDIEKMRTDSMDGGIRNLFTTPLVRLLEKSKDPAEAIRALLSEMSDFYRQTALNLLLREATGEGDSWFVTEALLKAGADPNGEGKEIPLNNALQRDNKKTIEILYKYGANPSLVKPELQKKSIRLRDEFPAEAKPEKTGLLPSKPAAPAVRKLRLD